MAGHKAVWADELLELIHDHPDWDAKQLSRALDGQATVKQILAWRNNHRREIAEMFGDTPRDDCSAEAVEEAAEIVGRLAAQTDEERAEYMAEIVMDGRSPADILAEVKNRGMQVGRLKTANAKYKAKIDQLERNCGAYIEQIESLKTQLEAVQAASDILDRENDDRALTLMQALEAKERAEKALTEANETVSEYAERYDELVIERDRMFAELEATKALLEKFRAANEELSARGSGMDEVTELKVFIAEKYLAEWRRG